MNKEDTIIKMDKRLEEISNKMEQLKIAEYVGLLNSPKKLFYLNFVSGIFRGLGTAIGFILLGATMIWILGKLAFLNIPIIGEYVTEIVKIVRDRL